MEKTALQEIIEQIGLDTVKKSMGTSLTIGYCDLHGHYSYLTGSIPDCPTCPSLANVGGNGVTATQVEHYINASPLQDLDNPNQKINPMGI